MSEPAPELNFRERELLEFASAGASEEEIAAALAWPVEEVGPRLDRLAEKLGVDGRAGLVGFRLPEVERPPAPAPEAPTTGRASWDAGHHEPERRGGFAWQAVAGVAAALAVLVVVFVVMTSGDGGSPAAGGDVTPSPEPATPRPAVPTPTVAPLTVGELAVVDARLGEDFDARAFEVVGTAWCTACAHAPNALLRVWREDGGEVQSEVLYQFTEDEPVTVGVDRRDGILYVSVQGADGWTRLLQSTDRGATWEEYLRLEGRFARFGPGVVWAEGFGPEGQGLLGYASYPGFELIVSPGSGYLYLGVDGEGRGLWAGQGITEEEEVVLLPEETPVLELLRPVRGSLNPRVRYGAVSVAADPGTEDLLATWILFGQAGPATSPVLVLVEDGKVVKALTANMYVSVLDGRWAFGVASYQSFGRQVEFFAALDLEAGTMHRVPLPWDVGEVTGFSAVDVRIGE